MYIYKGMKEKRRVFHFNLKNSQTGRKGIRVRVMDVVIKKRGHKYEKRKVVVGNNSKGNTNYLKKDNNNNNNNNSSYDDQDDFSIDPDTKKDLNEVNEMFKREMEMAMNGYVTRLTGLLRRGNSKQKRVQIQGILTDLVCESYLDSIVQSAPAIVDWVGTYKILAEKGNGYDKSDFYIFDLQTNKAEPTGGILPNHRVIGGLAFVDKTHTVYALGDTTDSAKEDQVGHSGASFLNLSENRCKWSPFPPMFPRLRMPYVTCTTVEHKLFCLFAPNDHLQERIGVFCDTSCETCEWRPIPPPLDNTFPDGPLIDDPINKRLLCVDSGSIYAYSLSKPDNPWVRIADNLGFHRFKPATSTVDGVLYFCGEDYGEQHITAYDIREKRSLNVSWSSHYPIGPSDLVKFRHSPILHLGGNVLCVYTTSYKRKGEAVEHFLEFYRLQARRISPQEVCLDPLSCHHFPVDGFPSLLTCVPV